VQGTFLSRARRPARRLLASDYYLVLDNRRGAGPVKATATIRAERGAASPSRPPPAKGGKLNEARAGAAPAA